MGWGNCGKDNKGRNIGYCIAAKCDHKGCKTKIDRGLAYACGGMHGEQTVRGGDTCCEGYFCEKHLYIEEHIDGECVQVCKECKEKFKEYWKND